MAEYKHILVYGEIIGGQIGSITKELLGGGRSLAGELGEELIAVFAGNHVTDAAREAYAFGADRVYVADNPDLANYETDLYVAAIRTVLELEQPRFLIFGHTDVGADLGPHLAFRLNVAITTDCVKLSVEEDTKHLLVTKPVYGGAAMALFSADGFPQIATVRPKSLMPIEKMERTGEIRVVDADLSQFSPRVHTIEKVVQEEEGIKLEDAEVIVSGGRGIGDVEGFKKLEELAKYLKAAVGASRVPCDEGWVSSTIQVGITGKIVAPKVYIAIGISGSSQHMTGCSRSKTIVAINKDSAAAIFQQAQYGVVGDWKVVLPAFMNKLTELE
jgi:caffeyl-CoA reductase-Etf complex subunit CarE